MEFIIIIIFPTTTQWMTAPSSEDAKHSLREHHLRSATGLKTNKTRATTTQIHEDDTTFLQHLVSVEAAEKRIESSVPASSHSTTFREFSFSAPIKKQIGNNLIFSL